MAADPIDIITLEEAKRRLRILHDDEDESIQDMITDASAAIVDYIKLDDAAIVLLSPIQSRCLRAACQNMVKWLYNDKDNTTSYTRAALGYLPDSVTMTLHRIRKPSMA
jgi:hypothetical protein